LNIERDPTIMIAWSENRHLHICFTIK